MRCPVIMEILSSCLKLIKQVGEQRKNIYQIQYDNNHIFTCDVTLTITDGEYDEYLPILDVVYEMAQRLIRFGGSLQYKFTDYHDQCKLEVKYTEKEELPNKCLDYVLLLTHSCIQIITTSSQEKRDVQLDMRNDDNHFKLYISIPDGVLEDYELIQQVLNIKPSFDQVTVTKYSCQVKDGRYVIYFHYIEDKLDGESS